MFLSRAKNEATVIRRIFKGEPGAYRHIIERYQPIVYAVALAQTGNVHYADRVVVEAFLEGFNRLVSLADPKRLGTLLCSLAQGKADELAGKNASELKRPRRRLDSEPPVDLKFIQSELIEPLIEELGSFTVRERKGLMLHIFAGMSGRQIADTIRIERKEAEEDLARTCENVEHALLKEISSALHLEVNNGERLAYIMTEIAGPAVAEEARRHFHAVKPKGRLLMLTVGVSAVILLLAAGYFGYRAYKGMTGTAVVANSGNAQSGAVSTPSIGEGEAPPEQVQQSDAPPKPTVAPSNYAIVGRVVDRRFVEDGIAGLTISAGEHQTESDFYGAFEIRGVTKGQHDVTISAGGVVLQEGVRLSTEEKSGPIGVEMNQHVPARFHFHGRVFDGVSGQVIPKFEVAVCKAFPDMLQPYLLREFREQSHPEGLLTDRFVTLGDYTMYVRAHGYAPLPIPFTIDENWDEQRVFEIGLLRAALLEGNVLGANELSIAQAAVMPRQGTAYGTATGAVQYTATDSMGRFSIYDLPVGVQSFIIHHLENGTGRAIVNLEAGKTTQIKVQFPKKGSLTGDITHNKLPTQFKDFRRRLSGSSIDLTKNLFYNSPGQYEVTLTPEPVVITASIAPTDGVRWFERRLDREVKISMNDAAWLDFNFDNGAGAISGNISLRGSAPRSAFIEVVYSFERSPDKERIYYNAGNSGSYAISDLRYGSGEVFVYCAPRAVSESDFSSAKSLLDKKSAAFTLDAASPKLELNFAL